MSSDLKGLRQRSGIGLFRPTAAEMVGFLPALALGWLWHQADGVALALLAGLPLIVRNRAAGIATATSAPPPDIAPRERLLGFLEETLARSAPAGRSTACIALRIDAAQKLVEQFGQRALDIVMHTMVERMASALRPSDCVVCLGSDTLGVAPAPGRHIDLEGALQMSDRLLAVAREPFSVDAATIHASVSAGFCLTTRAPEPTAAALLGAAEAALEEAWRSGPAALRAYSDETVSRLTHRVHLTDELRDALENGEIIAYFQPQLSTDTGQVTGVEALARWRHPVRGLLPPAEFLPLIQSAGLSTRLSEIMLYQTLTALKAWDRAGYRVPTAGVNFSDDELRAPQLAEKLRWELDRFDLPAGRLTIEILESVVAEAEDDMVVHNISALAHMGCSIDLDDFGTGHASITSIRRFAVNRIKIDRSFITRVDTDPDQQQMVAAILSMAGQLKLQTLAEGVELAAEHAMLAQLGCEHVQGFAIARPMPFEDMIHWLDRHQTRVAAPPKVGRKIG